MTHRPRKRFGQNFLRDENVVYAIVAAVGPRSDEHVVEIGPGQGALTRLLLAEAGLLDVVELDRDLVAELERRFAGEARLRIHSRDAMKFDFSTLAAGHPLRVVGNLPYNISTPLLFHLFEQSSCIADMHFMLQKEVVDRLCASPGDKNYGRLSIMAQYYCAMEPLFEVAPECFYPPPKVTSAVVRLIPHAAPPVDAPVDALGKVVIAAFGQRRKTLRNALGNLLEESQILAADVDPGERAENLALEDYSRLARRLIAKD